jgi:alpha-tubulin suppressor-like RCC1 family protein
MQYSFICQEKVSSRWLRRRGGKGGKGRARAARPLLLAALTAVLCLAGLTARAVASAAPQPPSTLFTWFPNTIPVAPAPVDLPGGARVTAVAVGSSHSLALTSDGTVLTWDVSSYGAPGNGSPPGIYHPVAVDLPAGVRVTAIAAGGDQSLALTADGRVLAWGDDSGGQLGNGTSANSSSATPVPADLPARTRVTAIAAGGDFSLALTADGRVLAWGDNFYGQLGIGTTTNRSVPVLVHLPARTRVTAIAAGPDYGLALTSGGRVFAWGDNNENELGDNSACNSSTPVPVDLPAGSRVTTISADYTHSLAMTSDGRLLGWGDNHVGQVGDGTSGNSHGRPVWVKLPAGTRLTAIAAGGDFSLALTAGGRVLTWGLTSDEHVVPTLAEVPPGTRVTAIAAGQGNGLVLAVRTVTVTSAAPRPGGPVFASGINDLGQLGSGSTYSSVLIPADLPAGTRVTAIAADEDQSLALTSDGGFLTWGGSESGIRTTGATPAAMSLPAGTRVTAIASAPDHTLALTADGRILAWGSNSDGQLGCDDDVCYTAPIYVQLPAGTDVIAIAAGASFSLALTSDGRVLAWGYNGYGLMGDDNDDDQYGPAYVVLPAGADVTAIAAGGDHWLALMSDGRIFAWGDNGSGDLGNGTTVSTSNGDGTPTPAQADLPTGTQVTAIAAGATDSLAVTSDGRVLAWGYNGSGQLGNGSTTSSPVPVPVDLPPGMQVTAVAAGDDHTVAVTSDGRALAWGYNAWGQLGDGSTADSLVPVPMELPPGTQVTAVAAGQNHSLVLTDPWSLTIRGPQLLDGDRGSRALSPPLAPDHP